MLPEQNTPTPRFARMFELLRQKELARITAERLKDEARFEGSVDVTKQFQKDALRSFAGLPTGAKNANPEARPL